MTHIINFFKGMIVGIANIIPGLSGGTMAVSLGIYEKLIGSISQIATLVKDFFKSLKNLKEFFKTNGKDIISILLFAVPLALGAIVGIVAFSTLLEYLLNNYEMPTKFAFIGLVLGTMPLLFKKANKEKFKGSYLIPFIITILIGASLTVLELLGIAGTTITSFDLSNIGTILMLVLYGFIAAGSMIIPGISGSFILLLLGAYNAVLGMVADLNILGLIPFAIGAISGVVVSSKVIEKLLQKSYGHTYYGIIGFIIGSLPAIYPGFSFNTLGLVSVIVLLLGASASFIFAKVTDKDE